MLAALCWIVKYNILYRDVKHEETDLDWIDKELEAPLPMQNQKKDHLIFQALKMKIWVLHLSKQ
jgi:hypothetical protein